MMGLSFDQIVYLFTAAGRTGYMLTYGVLHHLRNPMPLGAEDMYLAGVTYMRSYRYGEFTQNVVQPSLVV